MPTEGIALKTIFKFSTAVAIDLATDYPLKYTFKYKVDSFTIKIGEYYENMVAKAQLPFSGMCGFIKQNYKINLDHSFK